MKVTKISKTHIELTREEEKKLDQLLWEFLNQNEGTPLTEFATKLRMEL